MPKTVLIALVLTACLISPYAFSDGLYSGPESIVYDSLRSRYLIANYSNGTIVQVDSEWNECYYKTGLGHALGMTIVGDTLYVSTSNFIGINLVTDEIIVNMFLPTVGHLDGMTSDGEYLYVVDTGGRIYRISLTDYSYEIFVEGLPSNTQDCVYDPFHDRILVVSYESSGNIRAIDPDDGTVTVVTTAAFSYFDGVTMDNLGNTYVSSHTGLGRVYMFDSTFSGSPELICDSLDEPAGLHYNVHDDYLAIPSFAGNVVKFIPMFAEIEADTTWGWLPLEVSFSATSRWNVIDWVWDFGDGDSAFVQSPSHTYTERGAYDVSVKVDDGVRSQTYVARQYIRALADTLSGVTVPGEPGESVEFVITASTSIPLQAIKIPVVYYGAMGLTLDSFSTLGCRTEYMDHAMKITEDPLHRRAAFYIYNQAGTPDLEAGTGPVLKVYFTIPTWADYGQEAPILIDGYSTYLPDFLGLALHYTPAIET
ncbi:MAG: PKD domain-containing protein, partial [candidate division Zixibacteria bacterium]|nr:PKD domain-containing protein [candidate division Zixibacteria bacterium]